MGFLVMSDPDVYDFFSRVHDFFSLVHDFFSLLYYAAVSEACTLGVADSLSDGWHSNTGSVRVSGAQRSGQPLQGKRQV